MPGFKDYLKRKLSLILRILLFVITIGTIVYFFPKEGKFKYEYSKGSPWKHEDLIAKFKFPIYKTDAEVTTERDSILADYKPCFQYDSTEYFVQAQNFHEAFDKSWESFLNEKDSLERKNLIKKESKKQHFLLLSDLIDFVYKKGIIESLDTTEISEENCAIVVLVNNVVEEFDCGNIFSQKKAYEYIKTNLQKEKMDVDRSVDIKEDFIKILNIDRFIVPNLIYDENKSLKVKEDLLQGIFLTRGIVIEKQRIISEGEMVNEENYQILESYKYTYLNKMGDLNNFLFILGGQVIFVFTSVLMLFLFLANFRKEILYNNLNLTFILLLLIIMIIGASLMIRFQTSDKIYLIPFVILPIIIRTFFDSRLALFIYTIAILLLGFFVPNGFEFVFLNFIAGTVAIFSLTNLYRRSKIFFTSVLVVLAYSFIYFGMAIIQEVSLDDINLDYFKWFGVNGLFVLTAPLLMYMFEKIFGFISDPTLMELSDTNQPLLRRLAEEAPGTFHHSTQVSTLAEEAIHKIGGNPLLVRAGAYYHDIGKLVDPVYFTENQNTDMNPHDDMEFDESAKAIISHITNGVDLARKHKLPKQIIDFIVTHQGTTKAKFFYTSYMRKYPNKKVDDSLFSYPGPKPFSKETAVLMMADAVEAASRALKNVTAANIDDLVENIINYQQIEDQFIEADITFKDITTIKKVFKRKLENMYHTRIEYPK